MNCIECRGHHPRVQCTQTGRCGACGEEWPCGEHRHDYEPRRDRALNFDQPTIDRQTRGRPN